MQKRLPMDTFRNSVDDLVDDAIDGLILSSGGALLRSPRSHHSRIVVRRNVDKTKVALISGGGAGHGPLHAGLVAPGLLTAAVIGGVFASPSADAVLTAIEAVTGPAGCLLIVKNYTGDTLSFALAAKRARLKGYDVKEVIIGDDISRNPMPRPRGIAGTVFVHKVVGYFAEMGRPVEEVARLAELASKNVFSIGVSRGTCLVPGNEKQERTTSSEIEIGLGIHGEMGREICQLESSTSVMEKVDTLLRKYIKPRERYAALFNNLGGLSVEECLVLVRDFGKTSVFAHVDYLMGPAALVTSLDMPGFSISIIKLESKYADGLLAPISHRIWPGFERVNHNCRRDFQTPAPLEMPSVPSSENATVRQALDAAVDECFAMRDALNELDAKTGDGDTGNRLAVGARALQEAMGSLPLASPGALLTRLDEIVSGAMGGTAGALLGVLCTAAATAFDDNDANWAKALDVGVRAVMHDGRSDVGDRSCVDALRPAVDALLEGKSMVEAAARARAGAQATKAMQGAAGRTAYVPDEAIIGVIDPGAEAVARIFAAISKAVGAP